MVMLFEYDHTLRRIYTDGRKLPENPDPTCMEFSVGHWEAFTTFVVETVGFHAWDSQKRTTKSRLLTGTALRDSARRDEESYLS